MMNGCINTIKVWEYGNSMYTGINKEILINPSNSYTTRRGGITFSQASTPDLTGVASTNLYSYSGKDCIV